MEPRDPDVTTDKVLDLAPTWAPFEGWSVLFDASPTEPTARRPPTPFDCSGPSPNHGLLLGLAEVTASVAELPAAVDHLAALPPSTYHVTVCDGLSRGHVGEATEPIRTAVVDLLEALPERAVDHERLMLGSPAPLERLLTIAERSLHLVLTGLEVRGHAIVAALDPAPGHEQAFVALDAARSDVLVTLAERTGLDVVTPWRPHVTLAYLANRTRVDPLQDELAELSETVLAELGAQSFISEGASVYAFDDMVTFWLSSTR